MKHTTRLSWTIGLAIVAPVMALTGCPGLFGGAPTATTSPTVAPSASPSVAPTPALRNVTIFTKIDIEKATAGARSFTLKNRDSAAKDLTNWAVSYEYKDGSSLAMVHARLVGANNATLSIPAGGALTFSETVGCSSGNCVKLDSALGSSSGVTKLGMQAGQGSFVLYKAATDSAGLTTANLVDYVQYGVDNTYTHAQQAVDAKVWESKTAVAPAPGATGSAIVVVTEGASGSANWKKE